MKTVVLGAAGFVGRAVMSALAARDIPALGISSLEMDLRDENTASALAAAIAPDDVFIFLAALTPRFGRGTDVFLQNLRIGQTACRALRESRPAHAIYFGTDAVYPFSQTPTDESSLCVVDELYGGAHRVRELMFLEVMGESRLTIARPSMIYGAGDPHNAYGPNRFVRQALASTTIELFGEGEELRDHIAVEDVADLVCAAIALRPPGPVNLATGTSVTYAALAELIAELTSNGTRVVFGARKQPVTHRRYDVRRRAKLFPGLAPGSLRDRLPAMIAELREGSARL